MLKICFLGSAKRIFALVLLCPLCLQITSAETIELKSKGSITGKILAEKHDQIVIDVGYTALVIPRNQIANISKSDADAPVKTAAQKAAAAEPKEAPVTKAGFFSAPSKS